VRTHGFLFSTRKKKGREEKKKKKKREGRYAMRRILVYDSIPVSCKKKEKGGGEKRKEERLDLVTQGLPSPRNKGERGKKEM